MQIQFDTLRITRNNILQRVESLSEQQLNTIPTGFNNNIIWNVAHVITTQQLLAYGLSGLEFIVPKSFIAENRKGTRPEKIYTTSEINIIKEYLHSTVDQLEMDYNSGVFTDRPFRQYTTSYNITLTSIEAAITFNNVHEGMHLGIMNMLAKFV